MGLFVIVWFVCLFVVLLVGYFAFFLRFAFSYFDLPYSFGMCGVVVCCFGVFIWRGC